MYRSLSLGDEGLVLNGFRLSRHQVRTKELWLPEINAGWGQVRVALSGTPTHPLLVGLVVCSMHIRACQ
jgi:hypothetical protein